MKILFALIMSYYTFATYYMGKDFTLKELKDGFKAQYIDKHPTASLDSMDVVYFSSKNAYKINENKTNNFICANPALHQAGDIVLPKSKFVILEEKEEDTGYLDKKFLPFEYKSREFNVMLRRDETLKSHLYYLEDEDSLSTEDRLALTCISMAIEQLPAGIFHPLWCDRGLYPAIFLKVRLDDFGCRVSLYEK